jgi:hypothetical protein
MFNRGEKDLRVIATHNINKEARKYQEGGRAMLVFRNLIEQFDSEGLGQDDLGLGQWTYMKFTGGKGVATQVICTYSPSTNNKKGLRDNVSTTPMAFNQQVQHPHLPQRAVCKDLLCQMKQWRAAGECLVLCLDGNENIYQADIGCQLTDLHGLCMKEVVVDFTGRQIGATFFKGCKPIDEIWAASDLKVAHACAMPVCYGIRDHTFLWSTSPWLQ